ncbi:hypothetical protein FQR65_LT10394 [Abscondita terminalis]|nr:hypothetical protein FQR65_LT10394 [Abscondita terminalis]
MKIEHRRDPVTWMEWFNALSDEIDNKSVNDDEHDKTDQVEESQHEYYFCTNNTRYDVYERWPSLVARYAHFIKAKCFLYCSENRKLDRKLHEESEELDKALQRQRYKCGLSGSTASDEYVDKIDKRNNPNVFRLSDSRRLANLRHSLKSRRAITPQSEFYCFC